MVVFQAWLSAFLSDPLLLTAGTVILLAGLGALVVMLRRCDGALMRVLMVLTGIAYMLALMAFIQPPALSRSLAGATLITAGADERALAGIAAATDVYIADSAWTEPAVLALIDRRNARSDSGRTVRIASPRDIRAYEPGIGRLRVLGFGFDAPTWFESDLAGAIDFDPPAVGPGIVDVTYTERLAAGERLVVDVAAVDTASIATPALVLRAADDRELDRRDVAKTGATRLFADSLKPGRQLLRLSLVDAVSGRTIEEVTLPLQVIRPPPARLLALQGAPSFEWRALLRWARDVGAPVAARVAVSDERFRERRSPGITADPAAIDATTLAGVDLVIADGTALGALRDAERAALLDPSHGAGVLVLVHDARDAEALPPALADVLLSAGDAEIIYRLADMGTDLASGLSRAPLRFDEAAVTALLRDDRRAIVAARLKDKPHVALSLLRDSYRMAGVGLGELYARTWSQLVKSLARPIAADEPVFQAGVRRRGQRLRVCVPADRGAGRLQVQPAQGAAYNVSLHDSAWRPGERCAWLWPGAAGWLSVSDGGGLRGAHYVAADTDWQQRDRQRRVDATLRRAAITPGVGVTPQTTRAIAMPRDWPLIALLVLALFAWLIQRLAIAQADRRDVR